jgi:hypothetical protein
MQTVDVATIPLLLTVAKAVEVSGISRTELYNRLRDGTIRGRKLRRHTLIETSSLLGLLENLPAYNA